MTCDFLVDKNCSHPENAYFLTPVVLDKKRINEDTEVSISTAAVIYKCIGEDNCEVYKVLQKLKVLVPTDGGKQNV